MYFSLSARRPDRRRETSGSCNEEQSNPYFSTTAPEGWRRSTQSARSRSEITASPSGRARNHASAGIFSPFSCRRCGPRSVVVASLPGSSCRIQLDGGVKPIGAGVCLARRVRSALSTNHHASTRTSRTAGDRRTGAMARVHGRVANRPPRPTSVGN